MIFMHHTHQDSPDKQLHNTLESHQQLARLGLVREAIFVPPRLWRATGPDFITLGSTVPSTAPFFSFLLPIFPLFFPVAFFFFPLFVCLFLGDLLASVFLPIFHNFILLVSSLPLNRAPWVDCIVKCSQERTGQGW